MSIEALWSVEFVSSQEIFGAGVAVFETNRVFGGDANYTYVGDYNAGAEGLTARIKVSHYAGRRFSIFGARDSFTLVLTGKPGPHSFDAEGYIDGEPQNTVTIRLTRRAELP
jgi:hypothetical protein